VSKPLRLEFEWTIPILRDVGKAPRLGKKRRWLKFIPLIILAVMFAVAGVINRDYSTIVFVLFVIATVLFILPRLSARSWQRELDMPMRRGNIVVMLGPAGADMIHPLTTSHFEWPAVVNIIEGKLALHLMLSPTISFPVPFDALPEGVTREDLKQRVDDWREGAVDA